MKTKLQVESQMAVNSRKLYKTQEEQQFFWVLRNDGEETHHVEGQAGPTLGQGAPPASVMSRVRVAAWWAPWSSLGTRTFHFSK